MKYISISIYVYTYVYLCVRTLAAASACVPDPIAPDSALTWFRVQGFRFRVSFFFGFRVLCFVFRLPGYEVQVSGFGFLVSCFVFRVSGFGLRFSGFGFRVCTNAARSIPSIPANLVSGVEFRIQG